MDLVYAIREVQVKQDSVKFGLKPQLTLNQHLVEGGQLAPVEVIAAEAEVKRREEDELTSVEAVTRAENNLKGMLLSDRTAPEWLSAIIPTEQSEPGPVSIDLKDAVQTALANRPELEQLKVQDAADRHQYQILPKSNKAAARFDRSLRNYRAERFVVSGNQSIDCREFDFAGPD